MSTSATNIDYKRANARTAVTYLAATAFCGFFSAVYADQSHGVFSDYMTYLALFPFCFGVLPYTLLYLLGVKAPAGLGKQLYNWGAISLTLGSLIKGIVEISGYVVTKIGVLGMEVNYALLYFTTGALLMVAGVAISAATAITKK